MQEKTNPFFIPSPSPGFGHSTALGGSRGWEFGQGIWVGKEEVGKVRGGGRWHFPGNTPAPKGDSSTFPTLPCPIPRLLDVGDGATYKIRIL